MQSLWHQLKASLEASSHSSASASPRNSGHAASSASPRMSPRSSPASFTLASQGGAPLRVPITSARVLLLIPTTLSRGALVRRQRSSWLRTLPSGMNYLHVIASPRLLVPFELDEDQHMLWVCAADDEHDTNPLTQPRARQKLWTALHALLQICPVLEYVFKTEDYRTLRQPQFLHHWMTRLFPAASLSRTRSSSVSTISSVDSADSGGGGGEGDGGDATTAVVDYGGHMRRMLTYRQGETHPSELWYCDPRFCVLSRRAVMAILAWQQSFFYEATESIAIAKCLARAMAAARPNRVPNMIWVHQDLTGVWADFGDVANASPR